MDVISLLLSLALTGHIVLFVRSDFSGRGRRLFYAIAILIASLVLGFGGILVGLDGNSDLRWLAIVLMYAPAYLSVLSFTVYIPVSSLRSNNRTTDD